MTLPSAPFRCYLVTKDTAGKFQAEVTQKTVADLPPGEVLVRVAYSSLNYKDGLSATGHPGVTRKFPHVPGIDAAGTVVESQSADFRSGDKVIVTSFDMGQNTWGGFSEYLRVPVGWVVPLPAGMSLRESMIYGTGGLTAGLCIEALRHHGIDAAKGEVVVTGATGGVGSLAVALLAKLGYRVAAVTGKPEAHDYLRQIGAQQIIGREEVNDTGTKPLLPPRWTGAIDTVGGTTLATLVRTLHWGGCVAACGLVGGVDVPLTVYPFLLRGVDLAGIDSAQCPMAVRRNVWQHLATDWKPGCLDQIAIPATLEELPKYIPEILAGKIRGRVLIEIGGE